MFFPRGKVAYGPSPEAPGVGRERVEQGWIANEMGTGGIAEAWSLWAAQKAGHWTMSLVADGDALS